MAAKLTDHDLGSATLILLNLQQTLIFYELLSKGLRLNQ
jgi:hypothetical protein